MSPQPKQEFVVETTWIREYAKTYLPSEAGFSYSAEHLRKMGLNLIAIRNVLRKGYVVYANKLDSPGALWIVEGDDNEGIKYRVTLTVISEILGVSLVKVERV
ncbi:MAG TPA: hypothetical protein VKT99_01545 [Xanthobacteraceae bacterium]|jgi:hypothetical protein|nr:hypothetical protein [Xanthobacteraceae bacterium]